jgi:hypothetical protein
MTMQILYKRLNRTDCWLMPRTKQSLKNCSVRFVKILPWNLSVPRSDSFFFALFPCLFPRVRSILVHSGFNYVPEPSNMSPSCFPYFPKPISLFFPYFVFLCVSLFYFILGFIARAATIFTPTEFPASARESNSFPVLRFNS